MRAELEVPNLGSIRELILGDELLTLPGVPLQDVVFEGGGDEARSGAGVPLNVVDVACIVRRVPS